MNESIIAKAGKIIQKNTGEGTFCTLALIDLDGSPTMSTITAAKSRGIETIYLCTGYETKRERIDRCNRASVCFNSGEYNITLVGHVAYELNNDVRRSLWYDGLASHFGGPRDSKLCVLRFTAERYNLFIDGQEARGSL